MAYEDKSPTAIALENVEALDKSPFVQGLLAGAKGALVGGPLGAAIQYARGKSVGFGALAGALGAGAVTALARATRQDVSNQVEEGRLRYFVGRMKAREPLVFMPPAHHFGPLFTRFHDAAHAGAGKDGPGAVT